MVDTTITIAITIAEAEAPLAFPWERTAKAFARLLPPSPSTAIRALGAAQESAAPRSALAAFPMGVPATIERLVAEEIAVLTLTVQENVRPGADKRIFW